MELLFATQNQGKIAEINSILSNLDLDVLSIPEANSYTDSNLLELDVAETGSTFRENALLKAESYARLSGLLTAADDSGLQVKKIEGFPGVNSARWLEGTDQERNQALLIKMAAQLQPADRQAEFTTVICLYNPQNKEHQFFRGSIQGRLAKETQGEAGFGYDPIFIPEGHDKTFAQLGIEVKNKLSHRRRALEKLKQYLQENFSV